MAKAPMVKVRHWSSRVAISVRYAPSFQLRRAWHSR